MRRKLTTGEPPSGLAHRGIPGFHEQRVIAGYSETFPTVASMLQSVMFTLREALSSVMRQNEAQYKIRPLDMGEAGAVGLWKMQKV